MDFEKIKWNINNYDNFVTYLKKLKDEKYAAFHKKLVKGSDHPIIGIKTPLIKDIAKKIAKGDYIGFIKYNKHYYYEELILYGLVITNLKIDFNKSIILFDNYIKLIDSWASCDIVVANYKLFKKNLDIGFEKIKNYLNDKNVWIRRVGLVLLIGYYINDKYIDNVLILANNIKTDEYYVKMANAWLISICLIKYYDKTYKFLLNTDIDDWTYNKAIQKAIESYRITNKEELKKLKRK